MSYSAEKCFNLRKEFFEDFDDDFDEEPVNTSRFSHGDFQLVGHGKVTNGFCGKFLTFKGCLRVDLHNLITLDGKSYKGKVFVRKVHHWCNKPSCPICFKSGWAVRQAGSIEERLAEASKRFGLVEHIVASVPPKDYGLSYKALRKKAVKVLAVRGIIGGVMIFHGFRYNLHKRWYWSPHFHVLGFVLGGYHKCRRCKNRVCVGEGNFVNCDGFDAKTRRLFVKDGYIVRVLGKRKTVGGTAWYQLNHSSIHVRKKRFHVAVWFGVVSYRKLKVTVEKRKELCPICQHDLIDICYYGVKHFVTDRNCPDFRRDSLEDYEENGYPAWAEKIKRKYGWGSGSYDD